MTNMDLISTKILEQIEAYITEDNLKNDYTLANCIRHNDGWIRLELLNRCNQLSMYNYDTILYALCTTPSNTIELSTFEPRCIRRRCQQLSKETSDDINAQTVVITGLPFNISYEELYEFFNQFYPVKDIKRISSFSNRFNGKIHVIFNKSDDANAFVQQSKSKPIIFVNEQLLQACHGYTIVCQLLNKNDFNPKDFMKGKSFSTRLNSNHSSRQSFNTNRSIPKNNNVDQQKFCLQSTSSATDQILFCQNLINKKSSKILEYEKEKIVFNKFVYQFYRPDHLLKQIQQCIIISTLNPYCFTIQLRHDALEFDKFQREINDFYNTINDKRFHLKPEQIQTNLCVICLDSKSTNEKKIWNRSQILDFDPLDNTVNLFYVDLGTWDEYVPLNRLRHIIDRFHHQPVLSITCRLAHILPLNDENDSLTWTDEATNQFLAVLEQSITEIELLSFTANGCLQVNLFISNSGQHVCVNDYMIHIKQAKAADDLTGFNDDDERNSVQSDERDTNSNSSSVHPVIALYNRFGEILQQSIIESRTTSISSSSLSSPSTLPRLYVKLMNISLDIDSYHNQQSTIPLIFVRYQDMILIPDFNIVALLKVMNPNLDLHTVEHYAFAIRYDGTHISKESDFDIFTQLSTLIDIQYSNSIGLYTLDFVDYILKHHNFQISSIWLALENAKHATDLSLWFTIDNEFNKSPSKLSIPYRLPFSNRLINPM